MKDSRITTINSHDHRNIVSDLVEIWGFRELFVSLAVRDIRARYKQSLLGILWVVIQPIVTCVVFTFVFGNLVKVSSGDIPYPVFVFSGLLLWQFFSKNLVDGVSSLVSNSTFINKIYFPRLGIPLIGIFASSVEFMMSLFVLFVLMYGFSVEFHSQILFLPIILVATIFLSFSISLIFAPLNAIYRDVGLMTGYGVQFLMYLSPVIYPVTFVPEAYQWLYDFNPVATLINSARWALIGADMPSTRAFVVLCAMSIVLFVIGRVVFRRLEPTIVDRI